MTEESQIDTKTMARMSQEIDDVRCALHLLMLLVLLITIALVVEILTAPYTSASGLSLVIIMYTVVSVPAIVFILRRRKDKSR